VTITNQENIRDEPSMVIIISIKIEIIIDKIGHELILFVTSITMESTLNEPDVKSPGEEEIINKQIIVPEPTDDDEEKKSTENFDRIFKAVNEHNSVSVMKYFTEKFNLVSNQEKTKSKIVSKPEIIFTNADDAIYLKIIPKTGIQLYLPKGWLRAISPYFCAMLSNSYLESTKTELNLEYDSHILSVIFEMITLGYKGYHIITEILSKITTSDDVCELLHACSVFQLDEIQSMCNQYFSTDNGIDQFISANFLITVNLLDMQEIKKNVDVRLKKNHLLFDKIDFEQIDCKDLDYFPWHWPCIMLVLDKWTCCHDPTDKEFSVCKLYHMSFKSVPYRYADDLTKIMERFTLATEFKERVLSAQLEICKQELAELKMLTDTKK